MRRIAASIAIGFVATIAVTGIYAVSETHPYLGYRVVLVRNTSFGFPSNWILATYPMITCPDRCSLIPVLPDPSAQIGWITLGFNILVFTLTSYPLTILVSRIASRLNTGAQSQLSTMQDRIVMGGCALSLVWLLFYLPGMAMSTFIFLGIPTLSTLTYYPTRISDQIFGFGAPLLLFFSLIGVSAGILSTCRLTTGGAILASVGAILLFFPNIFLGMFFLNPEFGMLYILWTSIMMVGGILSLRRGILQTGH